MNACPSLAELESLVAAGAVAADRERLERHLAGCAPCREARSELARDAALFDDLKRAAGKAPSALVSAPDGYRIDAEIHRGGQGVVYAATQLATHRRVALKLLSRGRDASRRDRLRFEREVDLAARLQHPGIVRLYDSGVVDGVPYFAMELVEGQRLDEYLLHRSLDPAQKIALFRQIASAVAYAHRCGVIHRDLKPGNVLIADDGSAHVLDFGVARARDARVQDVTLTGEFIGTLAYAAPEQVRGDAHALDTRTDVYALGVVLYEMLTGHLPYEIRTDISSAIDNILHAEPAEPGRAHGVDAELRLILLKALEKPAAARYSSVDALLDDLERHRAREPLEARRHSIAYVLQRSFARHRVGVAVVGLLCAVGLLAAGAIVRERVRARAQLEQAALVRGVFQDFLAAASPERMGRDVRLLEVFEEAAGRIESALGQAPDVQGAVHLTIGDTYRRLLMLPEAVPHLRAALERYRSVDAQSLEVARCLELLGLALSEQGSAEAVELQRAALELRRARLPKTDSRLAASQRSLAIAHLSRYLGYDYARAIDLLEQALETFRATLGPADLEVAETLVWLGRAVEGDGQDGRAGRLFEQALAIFERDGADADPRAVACLNEYAGWLQRQQRFDETEELLRRSVELTKALWGDERSTEMIRRFARLEQARGKPVESERLARRSVANELERLAHERADADALRTIAAALLGDAGDTVGAAYAAAFEVLLGIRGAGAFELSSWANGIASALVDSGRADQAEPVLRAVLPVQCRAWGDRCPLRCRTLWMLGEILFQEQRVNEARTMFEQALVIAEAHERAEWIDGLGAWIARATPHSIPE